MAASQVVAATGRAQVVASELTETLAKLAASFVATMGAAWQASNQPTCHPN